MKTPYDSILRWRDKELEQQRIALAQLFQEQDAIAAQKQDILEDIETQAANPNIPFFCNFANFYQRQKQAIAQLEQEITNLQEEIDKKQGELEALFSEVKTLETAANRFIETAKAKQARKTQNELDDIAARRFFENQKQNES
jgi:flagellar export protein FliJ